MYDIIIIGAGPAGLTAAIYARRAMKKVLVLEEKNYGGQIINSLMVDNYPGELHISGFDFADRLYNQAKELGAVIKFEKVFNIKCGKKIKKVLTTNNTYESKTIIVAIGNQNRHLGLDNEERLTGKGISYCATCDGAFFRNKIVAVVGGGNTALDDALYLSDIAEKVYLIHRRMDFRADSCIVDLVKKKKNIEMLMCSSIQKICGKEKLESIEILQKNKKRNLIVDGLFVAIGHVPESAILKGIVNMNDDGYIIAKENCHTNKEGIFAAGDIRNKQVRQLVTATSDGAVAALEAINYINKKYK